MAAYNPSGLLVQLTILAGVFLLIKVCYRRTLHPLAAFPGPILGSVTSLWAASYDCNASLSLVKILPQLHKKYGPVVRVRPGKHTPKRIRSSVDIVRKTSFISSIGMHILKYSGLARVSTETYLSTTTRSWTAAY
jgi:hypothetical protein